MIHCVISPPNVDLHLIKTLFLHGLHQWRVIPYPVWKIMGGVTMIHSATRWWYPPGSAPCGGSRPTSPTKISDSPEQPICRSTQISFHPIPTYPGSSRGSPTPSIPSIRWVITADQLSSTAISIQPRYLNKYIIPRGCPYALKAIPAPSCASYFVSLMRFRSAPLV